MSITWAQALAWRLRRQLLEPAGDLPVEDVVRRLGAVPAMDDGLAELAIAARRRGHEPGDLVAARADGRIVKTLAFRGATHYLAADDGGAYLALRAASRQWELPSWQEHYGLAPGDWPAFRAAVRAALAAGPITLTDLGAALTQAATYRHLRPVFDTDPWTLLKALAWQGELSFGPPHEDGPTFQRLDGNPHWAGVWDLDEAGPHAIVAYLGAYGPATEEHLHYWLGSGLSAGRKRLTSWFAALGDRLQQVRVGGTDAWVLAEHADELDAARPTRAVRLLPGHDQWVLGPGTKDEHVVPPEHRAAVTGKANLVVAGGVVSGTWAVRSDRLAVTSFGERSPRAALEAEARRVAAVLGRDLALDVIRT